MNIISKIKLKINNITSRKIKFSDLEKKSKVYLYAGDVPFMKEYKNYVGLSLSRANGNHIKHNIIDKYPLKDNTIDRYQSEDVFEHILFDDLPKIINEIYRILKQGGEFRLSIPDYRCDILNNRSEKNNEGEIIFDPEGGGNFKDGKVINGGHVWFPVYEKVKMILEDSNFNNINFLHYYDQEGNAITKQIDYAKGYVQRTPDHDSRVQNPYRPMSIVVDCIK